jgi:hypothetical protein
MWDTLKISKKFINHNFYFDFIDCYILKRGGENGL